MYICKHCIYITLIDSLGANNTNKKLFFLHPDIEKLGKADFLIFPNLDLNTNNILC